MHRTTGNAAHPERRDAPATRRRILIVDDDEDARTAIARLVALDGHDVHTASHADEAIQMAVRHRPDVVLLDVQMPGRSGFDVCASLAGTSATAPAIIFVSGLDSHRLRARGLDLGAVDFVVKPVDARELSARIHATLRTRGLIESLASRVGKDALTGLSNRAFLDERLDAWIRIAHRYGRDLGCLMIDVDRFKSINDQHGHSVGDEVLREVARRLKESCRGSDDVVRYGGEEFVVIALESSVHAAKALAERIRRVIGDTPMSIQLPGVSKPIRVSVSLGIARLRAGDGGAMLLRRADEALLRAKQAGRNRIMVADDEPGTGGRREGQWGNEAGAVDFR